MTRYLITGAQGFVGGYLAARILANERDAEIVGIGRSAASPALPYRYRSVSLSDAAGLRELVREFRPHCVFHLAGALHTAPERDLIEANVAGTACLMNALHGSDALVIAGSSGSVYGEPASLPIAESAPCNPVDLYGATKLAAEQIARIKARAIVARIFNVVGPGQSDAHVCGRIAAQLASRRSTLEVGALDTTRDFIDVRDVAAALLLLAHRGERGGTYNVASGRETPIHAVLSELIRISGSTVAIESRTGLPRGVERHFADVSRLERLGFAPAFSLGESLRDLFRHQKAERHETQDPHRIAHQ